MRTWSATPPNLRRIAEFIEIPFDERMLRFHEVQELAGAERCGRRGPLGRRAVGQSLGSDRPIRH